MAEIRKGVECDYCGVKFHIKFSDDVNDPEFCCFCGEVFDDPRDVEEEEDDGDLDFSDEERDAIED